MGILGNQTAEEILAEEKKKRDEEQAQKLSSAMDVTPRMEEPATLESNLEKAAEFPTQPEQEEAVSEEEINKAGEEAIAATDAPDLMSRISQGTNYKDAMEELNTELAQKEAALSKGLKDERNDENISRLITLGIQGMAQMYAASKGIQTKLSGPIDSGHAARLKVMKEEVDNNRRILRSRIGAARGLLKDVYSQEKREDAETERGAERDLRRQERTDKASASADKRRETIDQQNIEIEAFNENQKSVYEKSKASKIRSFTDQWNKLRNDKARRGKLLAWGVAEDKVEDLLDKEGTSIFNIFGSDRDMPAIEEVINAQAISEATKAKVKPLKPGGTEAATPAVAPAPTPVETGQAISSEEQAARWRAQYPALSEIGKKDMERAFANSPYSLKE